MFDVKPNAHGVFPIWKSIALIGPRAVGKTALSRRCTDNHFNEAYIPTFEDVYRWRTEVDGLHYDVRIVDTDGLDKYSLLGCHYTIGIDAYILCFSLRDMATLQIIKILDTKLLRTLCALTSTGTSEIPRIIVGTNADTVTSNGPISENAQAWARKLGLPYMETSACTGYNVPNAFHAVLRIIEHNLQVSHRPPFLREPGSFVSTADSKTPPLGTAKEGVAKDGSACSMT